ncbi:MAG: hypothetical protein QOG25_3094 [Acetobacteraceae bacterium]|jgi:hypothetical protein|nr:hypothetical protein [Acetobacteraceae bacterium]
MPQTAIVTFTGRPIEEILEQGGSRDWRLDATRAQYFDYLVCTQNRHNPASGALTAPHRAAFLIGRISGVVPSPERQDRWLIKISEYIDCNIQNIWGKSGHLRYPLWYTTLEELGIDLSMLPPFRPMPLSRGGRGMQEMRATPIIAPANWTQTGRSQVPLREDRPQSAGDQNTRLRLDAILQQIDRIPDLPAPFDPLDWDEHGLPQ